MNHNQMTKRQNKNLEIAQTLLNSSASQILINSKPAVILKVGKSGSGEIFYFEAYKPQSNSTSYGANGGVVVTFFFHKPSCAFVASDPNITGFKPQSRYQTLPLKKIKVEINDREETWVDVNAENR